MTESLDVTQDDPLPREAYTFEDLAFDPTSPEWELRDAACAYTIRWKRFDALLTGEMINSLKHISLWYVENRSVSSIKNIHGQLFPFLKEGRFRTSQNLSGITLANITNFRAKLGKAFEWKLGLLSGFFQKWAAQGHKGVEPAAIKLLEEISLTGNAKGGAVKTQDSNTGPFTVNEALAIQQGISAALATGRMDLRHYTQTVLLSAFGSRSVQFAALKCGDLTEEKREDGTFGWVLRIPRAKQRLEAARSQMKTRSIIPEIAEIVQTQIQSVKAEFENIYAEEQLGDDLPIFPNWDARGPASLRYHSTGAEIGAEIRKALKEIDAKSERTGSQIAITPRRFRYTVGTRAAEEGLGELVIAELLDHTDTQQVAVYVMATQKIIDRINAALAMQLAPLAQAFAGVLIDDESEAMRGDDPASRIHDPNSLSCVGNCGRYSFCSASAPIACYTCRRFQAWVGAPHDQILDGLLRERDRVFEITGDLRIASVNDRTILAVAQVVHLCSARMQGASDAR